MTGKALICKLGKHIPIEGADRIVQVDMFGETIITQKINEEGTVGLLFDCETKLSNEYASANNMYRHSNLNKDESVTGYLEDNARIRPIKLKGVKCSGLFMPLDTIAAMVGTTEWSDDLIGQEIDEWDGVKICEKYISPKTARAIGNKQGKAREVLTPTFKEHIDTDQWGRNMHKINHGDTLIITEKLHGTSGRCGYLPTKTKLSWWKTLCGLLADGMWLDHIMEYKFVVGSRRVVKSIEGEELPDKEHYYNHDLWTNVSKKTFEGKLRKGETVYFEIVGYDLEGGAIMGTHSNSKLKPFMDKKDYKEFIDKYGNQTQFSYGCSNIGSEIKFTNLELHEIIAKYVKDNGELFKDKKHGEYRKLSLGDTYLIVDTYSKALTQYRTEDDSKILYYGFISGNYSSNASREDYMDIYLKLYPISPMNEVYVYRITTTNEDGESIDYSWEQVKARCEQMNVKHVPELDKMYLINEKRSIKEYREIANLGIDNMATEDSKSFPQHLREGVCIRVENKSMNPLILKHKSFIFKCLEGIIKDTDVVDIEESN